MRQDIAYLFLERTDSTQKYAKEHAATFSKDGMTCVYTDFQECGYGRKGDKWHAEKGSSVLATFVFAWDGSDPKPLSLLGPESVQAVLQRLGINAELKWPNDVLASGKKISGTLVDVMDGFAFVGIGVNVTQTSLEIVDQPATSVALEGKGIAPAEFLFSLGSEIEKRRLALR